MKSKGIFLGISSLDCDSTVTLVRDGRIVYAAQEERFTRRKQQDGFPINAFKDGLRFLGIKVSDIKKAGYSWLSPKRERQLYLKSGAITFAKSSRYNSSFSEALRHNLNIIRRGCFVNHLEHKKRLKQLNKGLKEVGYEKEVRFFNHQQCHAASAYYTSGLDKALVITLDGYGSGSVGCVSKAEKGKLSLVQIFPSPQSIGGMYGRVTKALGFIPNRHEGKVVGLAAYGNPNKYYDRIMKDFVLTKDGFVYLNAADPFKYKTLFKEGKKEDIAASFQKVLETIVLHIAKNNLRKTGFKKVCLAGGVAANVKMNQRIMELDECEQIFIHPAMADCGTAAGAALLLANELKKVTPYTLKNVFLGPSYSQKEILDNLGKFRLKFSKEKEIEKKVAKLLTKGYVIGIFDGRMEYGPRALGNRSILCAATDANINTNLNKRLKRTEFMPFAPITLDYMAHKMYKNIQKIHYAAEFMTVTTECTDEMKKLSPAAVHIDGTARPQIVTKRGNLKVYKILKHYYGLTGIPNLINTSFNIHEEPIVCTPYDALKTFKNGRLDFLAIGNYLVKSPKIKDD